MEVDLGRVVLSKAGRDLGRLFVIIEIIDELYVLIADGDLRRIEKPKKKKIKHLGFTNKLSSELNNKLMNKDRVTNAEIRRYISSVNIEEIV